MRPIRELSRPLQANLHTQHQYSVAEMERWKQSKGQKRARLVNLRRHKRAKEATQKMFIQQAKSFH